MMGATIEVFSEVKAKPKNRNAPASKVPVNIRNIETLRGNEILFLANPEYIKT